MPAQTFALINQDAAILSTNLLVILGIIAYGALLARIIPKKAHLPLNIIVSLLTVGIGLVAGLTFSDMGLGQFYKGLIVGGIASIIIIIGTMVVSFIPQIKIFFIAEGHANIKKSRLIFEATIRIPLGTALVEETLFRGLLLGLLLVSYPTVVAIIVSSLIFGLWHILPTIDSLAKNDAVLNTLGGRKGWHILSIIGVVLVTAIAGLAFSWLRIVSGSILAPWLVHWVINSSGALAAATHGAIKRKHN